MSVPKRIKDLANKVRNEIYGKDVRESIAQSMEVTGETAEEARIKSEEARDITQDLLDETFSSAALEQNFEQRLDNEIQNLQPEWTGFKDDVTLNLEQTMQFIDKDQNYYDYFDNLENAINESSGKKLILPTGEIELTSPLTFNLSDDIEIEGKSTTLFINENNLSDINNEQVIQFNNLAKTSTDIIQTVPKNTNKLVVSSVDNINVGDGITIVTDEVFSQRVGYDVIYYKGFVSKVVQIDGSTITIADNVPYMFNDGYNLRCNIYKPIKFTMRGVNLKVIGSGNDRATAMHLSNIFGGKVANGQFENTTVAHISLSGCYGMNIDDCKINGNKNNNIALNYGVMIHNANNININRLKADTLRHCISLSGTPPTNIRVNNSDLNSTSGRSFDSHSSQSFYINNSRLYNGIQLGLSESRITNTLIRSRNQEIINIRPDTTFLQETVFENCTFHTDYSSNNASIVTCYNTSNFEFIDNIKFFNVTFNGEHNNLGSFFRFDNLNINDGVGDLVVDNCVINNGTITHFVSLPQSTGVGISDTTNKNKLVFTNNILNKKVFLYGTNSHKIFKQITIAHNVGLVEDFEIYMAGTNQQGVNAGEFYVYGNRSKRGYININTMATTIIVDENKFYESSNVSRLTANHKQIVTNNLVGEHGIEVASPDGTYGWNRKMDGTNPYNSVGGTVKNLEEPIIM